MRNYGLIHSVREKEHYVLGGGSVPFESLQIDGDWMTFLPKKEFQDLNGIEPFACVSFTILNCIEILIKRKYGLKRNYSDRFLATVSGTKDKMGNDPHLVCEFLRKLGVPPEEILPFNSEINTFDKFYSPIAPKVFEIAKDFLAEFDFLHEWIENKPEEITKALQSSPLLISVPAWFRDSDGLYNRPIGFIDNHATTLVYESFGAYRRVFDSYDSPVIKDVRWDVVPMMVKRFYVKKKDTFVKTNFWQRLLVWFTNLFKHD